MFWLSTARTELGQGSLMYVCFLALPIEAGLPSVCVACPVALSVAQARSGWGRPKGTCVSVLLVPHFLQLGQPHMHSQPGRCAQQCLTIPAGSVTELRVPVCSCCAAFLFLDPAPGGMSGGHYSSPAVWPELLDRSPACHPGVGKMSTVVLTGAFAVIQLPEHLESLPGPQPSLSGPSLLSVLQKLLSWPSVVSREDV